MIKVLLKCLLGLTFILIVWGALVRGSGSGLGCPDWPLCHGQWIPPFEKEVMIEYFHRLLASVVGVLTLVFCIRVWLNAQQRNIFGRKCGWLLGLLLVQVLLGGLTVQTELHPHLVVTHLGIALIFAGLVFYMLLTTRGTTYEARNTNPFSHWRLAVVFLQILLGGLVAASNAGLACPDFPTCQGAWLPRMEGGVAIHFAHRVLAFFILGAAIHLAVTKWRRPLAKIIFSLVGIQILLGIGTVLMGLPLWMRLAHNGVAVLLFLSLVMRTYELRSGTTIPGF